MYAFVQDMPGVTIEDQTQLAGRIDLDAAPGFVAHVVGPIDGGCRIVDVWESEDDYRNFQRTQLWPALQQHLATLPPSASRGGPGGFSVVDVTGEGYVAARA